MVNNGNGCLMVCYFRKYFMDRKIKMGEIRLYLNVSFCSHTFSQVVDVEYDNCFEP